MDVRACFHRLGSLIRLARRGCRQLVADRRRLLVATPTLFADGQLRRLRLTLDPETDAIDRGLELERERLWADAIRHYDESCRGFPDNKTLYQRLVISRLHYDVNRRYRDRSFTEA